MRLISFFLLMLFTLEVFPQTDTLNILDGISKRIIKVEASGNGGVGRNSARFNVQNAIGKPYKLKIPLGLMIHSVEENIQDQIILEEVIADLGPRANIEVNTFGACTQQQNYSPMKGEKYKVGGMASEVLINLAELVDAHEAQDKVGQAAVWVITNDFDIRNVHHAEAIDASWEVAKFITEHRMIEERKRNNSPDPVPTPEEVLANTPTKEEMKNWWPASVERVVFSVRKDIIYHAPRPAIVTLGIYDSLGNQIKEFYKDRSIQAGLLFTTIGINDIVERSNVYYAILSDQEGNVLKKQKLVVTERYEPITTKTFNKQFEYIVRKPGKVSMAVYDEAGELIEVLFEDKVYPMSKRNMRLEFLHVFPKGTKLEVRVTGETGDVFHVEPLVTY